jgi:hypothetical protein
LNTGPDVADGPVENADADLDEDEARFEAIAGGVPGVLT